MDGVVEATLVRPVRVTVTEVPLAVDRGAVAARREDVGHRRDAAADKRPAGADRSGAVAQGVHSGHELTASGGAHRGDMEVRQSHTLTVELVEIRRLQKRVPVTR